MARTLLHRHRMMDALFLLTVVAFFAGAIAYARGCERL